MILFSVEASFGSLHLQKTHFKQLTLLVGVSGVGKTKIISFLHLVRAVGLNHAKKAPGMKWKTVFNIDGKKYLWEGKTSSDKKNQQYLEIQSASVKDNQKNDEIFLEESIKIDGEAIVFRDHSKELFEYKGAALPKLKWSESAITLLAEETEIAPLHQALQNILVSDRDPTWYMEHPRLEDDLLSESFVALQSKKSVPLLVRAKALQDYFPDRFSEIVRDYIDIFPYVEDVKIVSAKEYFPQNIVGPVDLWIVVIKEKDVAEWIDGPSISDGMLRTLYFLLELYLAPKGSIFLVDEFENNLGINCLPQLAKMIIERAGDLQFVLTSHHPYVINNIPWTNWKLVTRSGNDISTVDAEDVPALQTKSTIDRFYLLINSDAYKEGVR
ncbi:MAG: ATP-binding protein [Magnetococcales bacterium]|nr:ATP-binding protein [Magnetococcales bacterium]